MVLGVCAAISFWWAKRSHGPKKRVPSRTPYPADDSVCETRHPMMRTTTIRDMIELTTSGSGSGKHFILLNCLNVLFYWLNIGSVTPVRQVISSFLLGHRTIFRIAKLETGLNFMNSCAVQNPIITLTEKWMGFRKIDKTCTPKRASLSSLWCV